MNRYNPIGQKVMIDSSRFQGTATFIGIIPGTSNTEPKIAVITEGGQYMYFSFYNVKAV